MIEKIKYKIYRFTFFIRRFFNPDIQYIWHKEDEKQVEKIMKKYFSEE